MAVPIPITECIVLTMVTCVAWANYTWFHLFTVTTSVCWT